MIWNTDIGDHSRSILMHHGASLIPCALRSESRDSRNHETSVESEGLFPHGCGSSCPVLFKDHNKRNAWVLDGSGILTNQFQGCLHDPYSLFMILQHDSLSLTRSLTMTNHHQPAIVAGYHPLLWNMLWAILQTDSLLNYCHPSLLLN